MVLSRVRGTIRRGQEPDRKIVVDAVIPPGESNRARQRDTKAPKAACGYDNREPVRAVGTVLFPEPITNAGPGADDTQDAPQR